MEPITTELRRSMSERSDAFTGVSVLYCEKDRFVQLCDAIDAVHARLEQENDELRKTVYDMRREFDEWKHSLDTGWIRLPVDADGEPWHIGDRTESGQTIQAMGLNKHGWHFVGTVNEIDPSIHRHYHAPTVEDVLVEFGNRWHTALGVDVESKLIAEYAAKLQLKEDA